VEVLCKAQGYDTCKFLVSNVESIHADLGVFLKKCGLVHLGDMVHNHLNGYLWRQCDM